MATAAGCTSLDGQRHQLAHWLMLNANTADSVNYIGRVNSSAVDISWHATGHGSPYVTWQDYQTRLERRMRRAAVRGSPIVYLI